jgi:hypothetical protein
MKNQLPHPESHSDSVRRIRLLQPPPAANANFRLARKNEAARAADAAREVVERFLPDG